MSRNRTIKESVRKLANTFNKDSLVMVVCNVDSIDLPTQTCNCTPISGDSTTQIPSVSFKAQASDGLLLVPKKDSVVVVALSQRNTSFVALYSDIDMLEVAVYNGTQKTYLTVKQGLAQFNDGSYDGIIKINDAINKLNNLENKVNDIIAKFATHTHLGVTVGAGVTGITGTPVVGVLTPTVKSDLENPLVKHGK